jgi:hypothetical protein
VGLVNVTASHLVRWAGDAREGVPRMKEIHDKDACGNKNCVSVQG